MTTIRSFSGSLSTTQSAGSWIANRSRRSAASASNRRQHSSTSLRRSTGCGGDGDLPGVQAGQQQQVRHQRLHLNGQRRRVRDGGPIGSGRTILGGRDLQRRAQGGQRRAQLVAHVGGEATLARERGRQPRQQLVQLADDGRNLRRQPRGRDRAIDAASRRGPRSRRRRRGPAGAPAGRAPASRPRPSRTQPPPAATASATRPPACRAPPRSPPRPRRSRNASTARLPAARPLPAAAAGARWPARAGRPAIEGRRARAALRRHPGAADRACPATGTAPARARHRPRPRSSRGGQRARTRGGSRRSNSGPPGSSSAMPAMAAALPASRRSSCLTSARSSTTCVTSANAPSTAASTRTTAAVNRKPSDRITRSPQRIAEAAVRVNEAQAVPFVDLLAQVSDVDVDHVAGRLGGEVVDVLANLAARDDLIAAHRQVFEQRVFQRGQRDRRALRAGPPGRRRRSRDRPRTPGCWAPGSGAGSPRAVGPEAPRRRTA